MRLVNISSKTTISFQLKTLDRLLYNSFGAIETGHSLTNVLSGATLKTR